MIEINIEKNESEIELLKPSKMLDNLPYGTVFEQWFEGKPSNTFFLTCVFLSQKSGEYMNQMVCVSVCVSLFICACVLV